MQAGGSVSTWIRLLKDGDEAALSRLHARYWPDLVGLARRRLTGVPRRAADEEDVAQEAFQCLYRGLKSGRWPHLVNRHHLLALLTVIVTRRAANLRKHEMAVGGQPREEGALGLLADDTGHPPDEQALLNDCYRHYVGGLPDDLRAIAEMFLAGFSQEKIAGHIGCTERTVQRKIDRIRKRWKRMAESEESDPQR
jgi:DNA-directed RNA polymerase specialized sigma24 family protein